MPRYPYPPHDFECLYRHSCPYLDGLSTRWVLGEYRRADDVYQEHLRIIDGFGDELKVRDERIRILERENAELKAKLQVLHQRQFRPNKKKKAEPGGAELKGASSRNEGKKKRRGAPVGHPGWVRPKPESIDRSVHVPAPKICPHCQSEDLTPMEETTEHFQEDIVIRPQSMVTRYLHGQAFCTRCNRPVVQAGEGELLNAPVGPVAKSVAIYLRYRMQKFLFTFLRRPGVPPTNNHAEQSLRHLVIFRKICFGSRSESGLKTHSILPSLVQTARRQGVHPRKFLQTLLTADTATAQAALYNNSS